MLCQSNAVSSICVYVEGIFLFTSNEKGTRPLLEAGLYYYLSFLSLYSLWLIRSYFSMKPPCFLIWCNFSPLKFCCCRLLILTIMVWLWHTQYPHAQNSWNATFTLKGAICKIVDCWISFPDCQTLTSWEWDSTVPYLSLDSFNPPFSTTYIQFQCSIHETVHPEWDIEFHSHHYRKKTPNRQRYNIGEQPLSLFLYVASQGAINLVLARLTCWFDCDFINCEFHCFAH